MGSHETQKDIPFLRCRGSHYEVGYQIGNAFKTMIQDLLGSWKYFDDLLKISSTPSAKAITENSLKLCMSKFPGYVDEIKGMAHGAEIAFEKLFMLNIDSILCTEAKPGTEFATEVEKTGGAGCTTLICNKDEVILGHTEDALAEIKDHVYIISAEILNADGRVVLEKFTTLCYAGTLMGYTMGYNSHGMVYSVNTIFPYVCTAGSPRAFIARALLGAPDLPTLLEILKDRGNGVADGFSVNVYFYPKLTNDADTADKQPSSEISSSDTSTGANSNMMLYNIEVAPMTNPNNGDGDEIESIVDIHEIRPGTSYAHCNRYLRVQAREWNATSIKFSDNRHACICRHEEPCCEEHIKATLSDETDYDYPIYNCGKTDAEKYAMSFIRTVAVGIFDIKQKTWSVYAGPPASKDPEHIFKL